MNFDPESAGRDFGGQVRNAARVLREQWWIILLCVVVTTFAAAAYTSTKDKLYEASARLLLQSDNLSATVAGTTSLGGVDPTRQAATDAQLLNSPAVAARVVKRLKKPLDGAQVSSSANPDSNVLTVTVRDKSPRRAALIANAFGREFIAFRRDTTRNRYKAALRTVQSKLAQTRKGTTDYATLKSQARQLRLLVSLQSGDAQLVQAAGPPAGAVEPKPTRNILLGVVIGLLLGFALAFVRDRLDQRVKSQEQIAPLLPGVPIVGVVPEPRRGRLSRMMTAEGYHTLQANLGLLERGGRPFKSLLVTSAVPGEGKSTVALNLALAMIEKGEQALVLDADLRRPMLSDFLKADRRVGVSTILAGQGAIDTSVQHQSVEPSRNGDGPSVALAGELALVPAGPRATNVQLLLNDRSLTSLHESARQRREVVIFDGPPVGSFADLLPLAREVDGVLVVVRLYHSRKDQLARLVMQLDNAAIEPVGVVVLGGSARAGGYYYGDYLSAA